MAMTGPSAAHPTNSGVVATGPYGNSVGTWCPGSTGPIAMDEHDAVLARGLEVGECGCPVELLGARSVVRPEADRPEERDRHRLVRPGQRRHRLDPGVRGLGQERSGERAPDPAPAVVRVNG